MSRYDAWIKRNCPESPSGYHWPGQPAWDDRVLAQVITCTDCGEQWIVHSEEKPWK